MSSVESEFVLSLTDREHYAGKWIAVLDSKIIAKGENVEKVYKDALEASKGRTPLFEQVPLKQEETLIL